MTSESRDVSGSNGPILILIQRTNLKIRAKIEQMCDGGGELHQAFDSSASRNDRS